ncbi:MAG: winged helix-turn-helix domain-containing protein [Clostridiales bacterium]|jgi:DNA-binding response OmpR family regulator|nr:winged helix-turn-helix domain-containing protein [Clostridiales bacterium]
MEQKAAFPIGGADVWKPPILRSGPLVLDALPSRAYLNGADMELAQEEFDTLFLLVQREGKFMTKEELYESAWEQFDGADIRQMAWKRIDALRDKLNRMGRGAVRIVDLPREGYGFRLVGRD